MTGDESAPSSNPRYIVRTYIHIYGGVSTNILACHASVLIGSLPYSDSFAGDS